jgi:hypothetical protein
MRLHRTAQAAQRRRTHRPAHLASPPEQIALKLEFVSRAAVCS